MTVGVDRLTFMPKMFVSCLLFCWCLCIDWCNKNVPPISQCVLTSVSFIENRATHRPGSRDRGSLWCYCWITVGIGQQISKGLSAGWDWHGCMLQKGPNAWRHYCQSFCMQKCKNWDSSIARCVMQNNVIFSVCWNQEGWCLNLESFQTGAIMWKQQKVSTVLALHRRRFVWCAAHINCCIYCH